MISNDRFVTRSVDQYVALVMAGHTRWGEGRRARRLGHKLRGLEKAVKAAPPHLRLAKMQEFAELHATLHTTPETRRFLRAERRFVAFAAEYERLHGARYDEWYAAGVFQRVLRQADVDPAVSGHHRRREAMRQRAVVKREATS